MRAYWVRPPLGIAPQAVTRILPEVEGKESTPKLMTRCIAADLKIANQGRVIG